MDFELGEEQVMLKTSARDFLDNECPKTLVREMMFDEKGYSPELWKKMAGLGWQGMVIPEEYGGVGSGFLELVVLLEQMGRALVPGPFFPTVVLAGQAIMDAGSEEHKKQFLPGIAAGETIMTLAFMEAGGKLDSSGISMEAKLDGDEYVLEGIKLFVPDAHVADYIVCVARTGNLPDSEDGITLFIVDAASAGIHTEVLKTMTGEKLCEVIFRNVRVPVTNVLGELNCGWPVITRLLKKAVIAECAWMIGGSRWVLDTSVEYAKDRHQFGHPIGSFQAIQHKCANMYIELEGATCLTYYAAWAASEDDPALPMATAMAKAWCSDIYKHIAGEGTQIHGGIGFTWDHDMHLYFKRSKTSEVAFGDADHHREQIAQLLDL